MSVRYSSLGGEMNLSNAFRTLEERAKRLFATKGKSVDQLDPSLFAKSKASKEK